MTTAEYPGISHTVHQDFIRKYDYLSSLPLQNFGLDSENCDMGLSSSGIECDDDISSQTFFEKFELVVPASGGCNVGIEGCCLLFIVLHQGVSLDGIGLAFSESWKRGVDIEAEAQKVWRGC